MRKRESEMEKLQHSASTAEVTTTSLLLASGIYLCSVLCAPVISSITRNIFSCSLSSHTCHYSSLACNISSHSSNILRILICIQIKIHLNDNNVSGSYMIAFRTRIFGSFYILVACSVCCAHFISDINLFVSSFITTLVIHVSPKRTLSVRVGRPDSKFYEDTFLVQLLSVA